MSQVASKFDIYIYIYIYMCVCVCNDVCIYSQYIRIYIQLFDACDMREEMIWQNGNLKQYSFLEFVYEMMFEEYIMKL